MLYISNTFQREKLRMFHGVLLNLRKVFLALEIRVVPRSTPVFVGAYRVLFDFILNT